jgi:multidrug efflux pump subunit AcrB/outer membrane protein TolC
MSFTKNILSNKHAVWALTIAAAIFGTLAYLTMPMQLFPETAPPLVNVLTIYPGSAAEDVAADLSLPLEEEFASLEGVYKIRTTSQDNLSLISIEFRYNRDVDLAALDVQNTISRIRSTLPGEIKEPQVLKFSTSDRPVITVGVSGDDFVSVRKKAEDVFAPLFQRVDGVAAVDIFGGSVRAAIVEIDAQKLAAYHIPFEQVVGEIRRQNIALPAGRLRTELSQTTFRVEARAKSIKDFSQLPIFLPDGSRLLLKDIARVYEGSLDDDSRFSINGERYIALQGFKADDANTVDVVENIIATVEQLKIEYPNLNFVVGEESATFTQVSIDNLLSNVWQALLLASIIIFLFIGKFKASLVTIVSMPLSFGITFALMKLSGTEFNMVTLSAVILAVGMVVDGTVVVLENIIRLREEKNLDAEAGAIAGADEVRLPVLAGVATTLVVLIPLLFMEGFVAKTFGPLALTLIFAFSSSVLVALILVPVLSLYTGGKSRVDDWAMKIVGPFQRAMDKLRDFYLATLSLALRYRLAALGLSAALFLTGILLLKHQGMDVLPKMDGGSFFISLETPSGTSLKETERVVREVEALLEDETEIIKIQSQVGFEEGMRSFSASGAQGPTQGFITVTLTDRTERDITIWEIEERIRKKISAVAGIRVYTVRELGNTAKSTTSAPIIIRISGPDPLVLDRLGDEVVDKISKVESVVEPTRNWRIDQKRMSVKVDRLRAGEIGLSPAAVAYQMQLGSVGIAAGDFYRYRESSIPVWVRYSRKDQLNADSLLNYPVITPKHPDSVPLRAFATAKPTVERAVVTSEDLSPTLEVTSFIHGRALTFVVADVETSLSDLVVPHGYLVDVTGEKGDLADAKGELGGALGIALIAVYLLLVAQLRSFKHPITIMLSIPLSLIGVGIALWITGKAVSMPVMVGLVLLVGIVVNNAIILLDFIRIEREKGIEMQAALLSSVKKRFRPIMMTSFSTVFGMIPLASEWALGSERFSPLATAVVGGMTTATFLTMVVIPVLYSISEDLPSMVAGLVKSLRRKSSASTMLLLLFALAVGFNPSPAQAQEKIGLSVEESFRLAGEHSHLIKARSAEVNAAEARQWQAGGRFLPKLDLQARYSRLSEVEPGTIQLPQLQPDMPPQTMQLGESITDVQYYRATITQPLFTGFGLLHGYEAADIGVDFAHTQKTRELSDLRLRVEEAYFNLYKATEMHKVAVKSDELLREHLSRIEKLKAAGRATNLDVLRVETRLAEAINGEIEVRGAVRVARYSLNLLLGLAPTTELELLDQLSVEGLPEPADEETLEAAALRARPELLAARQRAELAKTKSKAAAAALWPKVSLVAGYTYANPNERYFPAKDEFNDSWDISALLVWTAWDWGVNWHGREDAVYSASAARHQAAQIEEATRIEVERHRLAVLTASEKVLATVKYSEVAEQALALAIESFNLGQVTSTEVLDREVEYARAKAALIDALVERQLAFARLNHTVGAQIES